MTLSKRNRDIFDLLWDAVSGIAVFCVTKLAPKRSLPGIAHSSMVAAARRAAVSRLEDQQVLADVALEDEDELIRMAAISRLESEDALIAVMLTDQDDRVVIAAIEKLMASNKICQMTLEETVALGVHIQEQCQNPHELLAAFRKLEPACPVLFNTLEMALISRFPDVVPHETPNPYNSSSGGDDYEL